MPSRRALAHALVGPMLERAVWRALTREGALPEPREPGVAVPGPDPLRIRLVGGAVVHGYGITSPELGMAGHLARILATRHGRGAIVGAWGEFGARAAAIAARLDAPVAGRVPHARVAFVGSSESYRLRPAGAWRRDLDAVLARSGPGHPPLVVVAAPRLPEDLAGSSRMLGAIARVTAELNAVTAERCAAARGVWFVPGLAPGTASGIGSTEDYRRAARAIAPAVLAALAARGVVGSGSGSGDGSAGEAPEV